MLRLALLATLACVAFSLPTQEIKKEQSVKDSILRFTPFEAIEQLWEEFKAKHSKSYEHAAEEAKRKEIFKGHVKKIDFHNYLFEKGYKSFELGLNEYADLEHKEFVSIMNGYKMRPAGATGGATYMPPLTVTDLPKEVDWRKQGFVTDVKNQGQCGSCWSFSSTGALEGQHYRRDKKLVSLSEQNLVDCSTDYGNNGCNGGLMDNAFKYIRDNKGIDTENSYPYEAKDDTCRFKKEDVGATDSGFVDIEQGNEDDLTRALANVGPIAVAIDAAHQSFQLYKSGVYDEPECSPTQLDHGVLAVGFGTEDGQDYYIVKNSWGPTWGDEGYIKMSRNKSNQCGIASSASYPLV